MAAVATLPASMVYSTPALKPSALALTTTEGATRSAGAALVSGIVAFRRVAERGG